MNKAQVYPTFIEQAMFRSDRNACEGAKKSYTSLRSAQQLKIFCRISGIIF